MVADPEGFVIFEASWTLDGDHLQFTDVETHEPEERFNVFFEWFWAGPWTRIGDAPSDTTAIEDTSLVDDDGGTASETTSPSAEGSVGA